MSLIGGHSELLAFGIFALDFRYSNNDNPNGSTAVLASGSLMLLMALMCVLLQ